MSDDGSGMGDAVQALPASVAEAELTTSEPEEPTPTETSEDVEETATITATDDTSSRQVLETMSLLLPALSNTTTDDVEDRTGQPMQGSSTESETVVVHSDSTIECVETWLRSSSPSKEIAEIDPHLALPFLRRYGCPANGTWDHSVVLQGSLTGSTADGAGESESSSGRTSAPLVLLGPR